MVTKISVRAVATVTRENAFGAIVALSVFLSSCFTAVAADPTSREDLIADLVIANRILYEQGILDGFGHVSVRVPGNPDHFFMARAMSPGLVTAADIGEFDLEGAAQSASQGRPNSERFIHSEIYKVRPDVKAVVHSHSPNTIPFGVTKTPLRPVFHDASHLYKGAPVFEMRNIAGDGTDLLVRSPELGRAVAQALGDSETILLRGHGDVVVAGDLRVVTYRAYYTEANAKLLIQALAIGGQIQYLSDGEGATLEKYVVDVGVDRVWDVWKSQVARK